MTSHNWLRPIAVAPDITPRIHNKGPNTTICAATEANQQLNTSTNYNNNSLNTTQERKFNIINTAISVSILL